MFKITYCLMMMMMMISIIISRFYTWINYCAIVYVMLWITFTLGTVIQSDTLTSLKDQDFCIETPLTSRPTRSRFKMTIKYFNSCQFFMVKNRGHINLKMWNLSKSSRNKNLGLIYFYANMMLYLISMFIFFLPFHTSFDSLLNNTHWYESDIYGSSHSLDVS